MHSIIIVALATFSLISLGAGSAACSKDAEPAKTDPAVRPQPADPAGQAGAAQTNPHANPHGGTNNPHAGPADPHGGGMAGSSGGGAAGGAEPTAADGTKAFAPFSLRVPKGWTESTPTSNMRAAQFVISGDAGDAELIVYYFGEGQGGSVEANVDRWYGQFEQPDGAPTRDKAIRTERKVDGLAVTLLNVKGRYVANIKPTSPEKHNEPNFQMLAAIIETDNGPYFFKMVGPDKTVTAAEKDFAAMIDSIKKK